MTNTATERAAQDYTPAQMNDIADQLEFSYSHDQVNWDCVIDAIAALRAAAIRRDAADAEKGEASDPDEPWVGVVADNSPAWDTACPKCKAGRGEECTSLVTGCCPDGMHAERINATPMPLIPEQPDAPVARARKD